jgi:hypothetical protein
LVDNFLKGAILDLHNSRDIGEIFQKTGDNLKFFFGVYGYLWSFWYDEKKEKRENYGNT